MPRNAQAGGAFQPTADYDLSGEIKFTHPTVAPNFAVAPTLGTAGDPVSTVKKKVTTITGDGAITIESGVVVLTKGSAAAITIAAPSAAQDGTTITIVAGTSWAHVVTGTNLFWAGETGGPFNKITTAAFIGSAATIVAVGGLWLVVSDQIATVGD